MVLAGAAQGQLAVGVTEDAGKSVGGGGPFFATLAAAGLSVNRVSVSWDPAHPNVIPGESEIKSWLPRAQTAGVRIMLAVAPAHAQDLTSSPAAPGLFATFIAHVAQTFPQVRDFVIGNEPNQPYFWRPQFDSAGKPLAGGAYEPVLAQAYDALKGINPTINVIGIGLSPRGNDNPNAPSNVSRSPARFLRDLGVAYRASHRKKPLMDELAFHPYPSRNNDAPDVGYSWPNAGVVNLDRIKQAFWDAFNGTAQPTFAETGKTFAKPVRFELDEVGWQVAIPPGLAALYHGRETPGLVPIDEQTQAQYYSQLITLLECDSSVRSLNLFHLMDESDLGRWQSGLERVDGSHRPSYDSVKQTIAQTKGECQDAQVVWAHATHVVSPYVSWGNLRRVRSRSTKRWSVLAGAGEEATFTAGIFKARTKRRTISRGLAKGRPRPLLRARGTIKAKSRVVVFPRRKLKPGRYLYAIRMAATMNPKRVSVFVSRPLRVSTRRR
jgi:hypothetical protein